MASTCFFEDLLCSICLSVFTEPVVLQCGHSFCRECIRVSLDKQKQCPVCRSPVERESLPTNHVLKSLAEKAAEKLQYIHDKENAELWCLEHDEKLKLYCFNDDQPICVICRNSRKHWGHHLKPVSEAAALVREELQSLVQQISADTQALKLLVQSQKKEVDSTRRRSQDLTSMINIKFKEMQTFLFKRERELTDKVKSDEQAGLNKMIGKLRELAVAIANNTKLANWLTSALQIQDQEHFLKKWSEEKKSKLVPWFFQPKAANFQVEKNELSLEPYESHLQLFVWKEMLQVVTPREEPLLLQERDRTSLIVSMDRRSATFCKYKANRDYLFNSTQSIKTYSGQHYWEVYVGCLENWEVGLPRNYLKCNVTTYQIFSSGRIKTVAVPSKPHKIGVYLNCIRKELSFYDADIMKFIHTQSLTSTTFPVYAHFRVGNSSWHEPLTVCRY